VVYVRHPSDTEAVRGVIESALGADAPMARHAVYLEADICRSDLLVEIEAHTVAAAANRLTGARLQPAGCGPEPRLARPIGARPFIPP
jgi:hypothetical protein